MFAITTVLSLALVHAPTNILWAATPTQASQRSASFEVARRSYTATRAPTKLFVAEKVWEPSAFPRVEARVHPQKVP